MGQAVYFSPERLHLLSERIHDQVHHGLDGFPVVVQLAGPHVGLHLLDLSFEEGDFLAGLPLHQEGSEPGRQRRSHDGNQGKDDFIHVGEHCTYCWIPMERSHAWTSNDGQAFAATSLCPMIRTAGNR